LRQEDESLLTNLAIAFHRIYNDPIKQSGNDLIDINHIAEKLNIQRTVHAINRDIVHSTIDKDIKIYILLDKNHYGSIVNISGFKGAEKRCITMHVTVHQSAKEHQQILRTIAHNVISYFEMKAVLIII